MRTLAIAIALALFGSVIGIVLYELPQQTLPPVNSVMDFVLLNESMLWVDDNTVFQKLGIRFPDRSQPNPHLKLIAIDEASLDGSQLGPFPWPRSRHGDLVAKLAKAGAKVVGFDVIFLENSTDPKQDAAFARAMHKVPTILPYTINTTTSGQLATEPLAPDLQPAIAGTGYTTVDSAGGWTLHQPFPIVSTDNSGKKVTYVTLAGAVIQQYEHRKISAVDQWTAKVGDSYVPLDGNGALLMLPFRTREYQDIEVRVGAVEQHITFAEILPYYKALKLSDADMRQFAQGNIVIVGPTAQGLGDFVLTPNGRYPGVFSNLRFMDQLISNTYITRSRPWINWILLILLPIAIAVIVTRLAPALGVMSSAALVLLYSGVVILIYGYTLHWIDLIHVDGAMFFTALIVALYRVITEGAEKREIKGMFGKHVSPAIVEQMLKTDDPKAALSLSGKREKVTIFYSDIRGFTAMSEKMTPEQIYGQLNEYFEDMCEIVFRYGGYVDKFIGDCLMAVFSAPVPQPNDAKNAVFAAIEQQEKIAQISAEWQKLGKQTFTVGMGLNTGEVVMGNLGSSERMNYTVIGDNVNTAARLYNVAKGGQTIISETTYEEVKDVVVVNELNPVSVKGKVKPLRIFEVIRKLKEGEVNPSKLRDPNEPVEVEVAAAH
ncbi:MAG: adenylate/guanylate cyclase domain-containing protein [Candidatus Eremiobacteraeota bacterium]|nr:adenylate/guanylate cyclase domain-containing protein [Candidatus Eremiobacteraeota bacterium]